MAPWTSVISETQCNASVEVGGCKNRRREDALKRHVVVTPGHRAAALGAGQVSCARRPLPRRTGHAGKDRRGEPGKEAGRSPPSAGRAGAAEPHIPGTLGRGVPKALGRAATLPRLGSAAPRRLSVLPA